MEKIRLPFETKREQPSNSKKGELVKVKMELSK